MMNYKDLHLLEVMLEMVKNSPNGYPEILEERIIECKKEIRKRNKLKDERRDYILVKDYGIDGSVIKFPLPEHIETEDEAREYFDEYERIHFKPTPYDCSGQQFTSWYKVFQKPDGRFWCYHSIGVDV